MKKPFCFFVVFISSCIFPYLSYGGLFGEHKFIGDKAFIEFVRRNHLESFLLDTVLFKRFGSEVGETRIPFTRNREVADYYEGMIGIADTNSPLVFSYGDLTGLSADHTIDEEQLFVGLFSRALFQTNCPGLKGSLINQVLKALSRHRAGIEKGDREGTYFFVAYALLAGEDKSHFQRPPDDFSEMISKLDSSLLKLSYNLYTNPCTKDTIFKYRKEFNRRIIHLDNAAKYALLHMLALRFIHNAAADYDGNRELIRVDIQDAIMFNAFADHFLQDAFASGHMSVQRSWRGFHNKGVHDYYNRVGMDVKNDAGQHWRTYGDNYYTDEEYNIAIQANVQSLQELWDYFIAARRKILNPAGTIYDIPLFDSLQRKMINQHEWPDKILTDFKAYKIMPMPLSCCQYAKHKLKHGSKSGFYVDLGYGRYLNEFTKDNSYVISSSLGLFPPIFPLQIQPGKDCHPGIESIFWVAFPVVGYNLVDNKGVMKNQYVFRIPVSFFDKIVLEFSGGTSVYKNTGHGFFSSSIGYEFKSLKYFWAPSVSYFMQAEHASLPEQGIKLALRLY